MGDKRIQMIAADYELFITPPLDSTMEANDMFARVREYIEEFTELDVEVVTITDKSIMREGDDDEESNTELTTALLDKMFEQFPDFDMKAENAQEEWEKLRWTIEDENRWIAWASKYLAEETHWSKVKIRNEVMWLYLDLSPRLTEEDEKKSINGDYDHE